MDSSVEQSALIERISEEVQKDRLDELERLLLAKFDVSQYRPKHTGRFLTLHKRRRKRLITRTLDQVPGLLDDVSHGQVQCVLQNVANWAFNAFTLETATGGRSLPVLCVHLFHWYGLLEHFNLDVVRVWKLFTLIEEGYHSTNPYHNSIHAADVTQAMHCFLQETQIRQHLSYLEIMASLIAAVTHDLDHPGVNQPFLVATKNHLAALYGNTSVLENHHWRSAICCLLESGVSEQLPDEVRPELQRHISSLILATDITRQQEFLTRFKRYLDDRELDMRDAEHRHFILQIALKCADISNPCRPWEISRKWSYKVCEEFFRQGDYERELNLPLTPLCDRHAMSIPKIQVGFFKFVVLPLYEEWHRFLDDAFSCGLMQHLHANQKQWEAMIQQEDALKQQQQADGVQTAEMTEASEVTEDDSCSLDLPLQSPSLCSSSTPAPQPPPTCSQVDPVIIKTSGGRRHSMPLSVCRSLSLAPRPTTARRESLPGASTLTPTSLSTTPMSRISSRSSLQQPSQHRLGTPSPPHSATLTCSLTSSNSSQQHPERPVSAENLLPDTSIASIANSLEASRLSSLVQQQQQQTWESQHLEQQSQSSSTRQSTLTRQQTFPPIQPYARVRYMSTTAEMSQCCSEVLLEADSSSSRSPSPLPPPAPQTLRPSPTPNSSSSSLPPAAPPPRTASSSSCCSAISQPRRHSAPAQSKQPRPSSGRRFTTIPLTQEQLEETDVSSGKVFFIGSPPDSPPRASSDCGGSERKSSGDSSSGGSSSNKRDADAGGHKEKSSKILRLMKENVDPRLTLADANEIVQHKPQIGRRAGNQGWARRRGSAPVGLLARLDDASSANRTIESYSRRGSVPADMAAQPNGGVNRVGLSIRSEKLSSGAAGAGGSSKRRSSLPHEAALGNLIGSLAQFAASDRDKYPLGGLSLNNNGGSASSNININNNNSATATNNNNNSNNNPNNNINSSSLLHPYARLSVDVQSCTSSLLNPGITSTRRGSVPADISELRGRDVLLVRGNSVNGCKSRGRKNKQQQQQQQQILRRRSSGGPEMFACAATTATFDESSLISASGSRKRELAGQGNRSRGDEATQSSQGQQAKRRGSLPVDVLALSLGQQQQQQTRYLQHR